MTVVWIDGINEPHGFRVSGYISMRSCMNSSKTGCRAFRLNWIHELQNAQRTEYLLFNWSSSLADCSDSAWDSGGKLVSVTSNDWVSPSIVSVFAPFSSTHWVSIWGVIRSYVKAREAVAIKDSAAMVEAAWWWKFRYSSNNSCFPTAGKGCKRLPEFTKGKISAAKFSGLAWAICSGLKTADAIYRIG